MKEKDSIKLNQDKMRNIFDVSAERVGVNPSKFDQWAEGMKNPEFAKMYYDRLASYYNQDFGGFDTFYESLKKKEYPTPGEGTLPKTQVPGTGALSDILGTSEVSFKPGQEVPESQDQLEKPPDYSSEDAINQSETEADKYTRSKESISIGAIDQSISNLKNKLDTMPEPSSMTFGVDPRSYRGKDKELLDKRNNVRRSINFLENAKALMSDPKDSNFLRKFWAGVSSTDWGNFATMGLKELESAGSTLKIFNKQKKGEKLSDEEQSQLYAYQVLSAIKEQSSDRSTWFNVGKGVMDMIPYMAQFVAFGGVGSAARGAVMKLTGKSLASRVGATAVGSAVQAPFHTMLYTDYADRIMKGETPGSALKKAWITAGSEIFTERIFADVIGKNFKDVIPNIAKKLPRANNEFFKAAKFDGILEEYSEELINGYMQAGLTGDQSLREVWNSKEQLETFLTVALVGGAGSAFKGKDRGQLSQDGIKKKHLYGMSEQLVSEIDKVLESDNVQDIADGLAPYLENDNIKDKDKQSLIAYSLKTLARKGQSLSSKIEAPKDNIGSVFAPADLMETYNLSPAAEGLINESAEDGFVTGIEVLSEERDGVSTEVKYADGTVQEAFFEFEKPMEKAKKKESEKPLMLESPTEQKEVVPEVVPPENIVKPEEIPQGAVPPVQSEKPGGYKEGTQGAETFDVQKPPVKGAEAVSKTTPADGYGDAVSNYDKSGARNVLVSQTKAPKKGRSVMVQVSAELLQRGVEVDPDFQKYYESIYAKTPGYSKTVDFWETPMWVAEASNSLPDADFYVIRDVEEAKEFLANAEYDNVLFSALDVNLDIIDNIAPSIKGKAIVGGYASNIDKLKSHPNVEIFKSQDTGMKDGLKAMGVDQTPGVDYRHFKGAKYIPRLCMSKGCLHKCKFCTVPKGIKESSPADIDQQIENMKGIDFELIYLDDKTFGQAKNYTEINKIKDRVKKVNPKFKGFIVQTTATQVAKMEKENPGFLKDSPVEYLEIGVESYNDDILSRYNKPHRTKHVDQAVETVRKAGKKFIPNIIIGFEEETTESYNNTIDFLKRNQDVVSHANIYNLAIYEGSDLSEEVSVASDEDRIETSANKSFHNNPELHKAKGKEMISVLQGMIDAKQKPKQNDSQDKQRVSGKEQEGQKPEQAKPVEGSGQEEAGGSGVLQEEEVKVSPKSTKLATEKEGYGAKNKIVTADRMADLRARLKKSGKLTSGIDPETMGILAEMAVFHVEAGARSFADFSKAMLNDVGDAVKPHLEKLYKDANKKLDLDQEPPKPKKQAPQKPGKQKESKASKTLREGTKGAPMDEASKVRQITARIRTMAGKVTYMPETTEKIINEANEYILENGVDNAYAMATRDNIPTTELVLMNTVGEMLMMYYGNELAGPGLTSAKSMAISEKIDKLQKSMVNNASTAGKVLAFWRQMKLMSPEGLIQHYRNVVSKASKMMLGENRTKEAQDLYKRIQQLEDVIGKQAVEIDRINRLLDKAATRTANSPYAQRARAAAKKRESIRAEYSREDLFGQASALLPITPKMMEMATRLAGTYIEQAYYNIRDIADQIAKFVRDNYGEEIDVEELLAKLKESNVSSDIEKARKKNVGEKVMKAETAEEAAKIIAGTTPPVERKRPAKSQKQLIKEEIQKLIQKHHSERDIDGLAESLVRDMGLPEAFAEQVTREVKKEITRLTNEALEKEFERSIQKPKTKKDKSRVKSTVEKMVTAINKGALTEDRFIDMFSEYFGLTNAVDQAKWDELERMAYKIEAMSGFGYLESMALQDFSRAVTELMPESTSEVLARNFIALYYANMLAGPTTHMINIISAGSNIGLMPIRHVVSISNWVRFLRAGTRAERIAYNPIARAMAQVGALARGLKSGTRNAIETMRTGAAESKYYEDRVGGVKQTEFERNNYRASTMEKSKTAWGKLKNALRMSVGTLRYVGRALAAEDQAMRMTIYEMQLRDRLRMELALKGMGMRESSRTAKEYLNLRGIEEEQVRKRWEKEIEEYEKDGSKLTNNQKKLRLRELVIETVFNRVDTGGVIPSEAETIAQDNLFTGERNGAIARTARVLSSQMNKSLGAKIPTMFFIPFTKVIGNVAEFALDHTPYGFVRATRGGTLSRAPWAKGGKARGKTAALGHRGTEAYYEQMARAWFGTIAMTGLAAIALSSGDDDDEPRLVITGGMTQQPDFGQGMEKNVMKKYSFGWKDRDGKIKWFPIKYIYLPQFAIPMGVIGALNDRIRARKINNITPDVEERLKMVMWSLAESTGYITDMTFAEGVADLGKATNELIQVMGTKQMSDKQKEAAITKIISDLAVNKVVGGAARVAPWNNNLINQTMRMIDPSSFSRKDKTNLLKAVTGISYFPGVNTVKNRDIFGEAIEVRPGESQLNIMQKKLQKDQRWNLLAEFDAIPTKPSPSFKVMDTGGRYRLTAKEYEFFVTKAGKYFSDEITKLAKNYYAGKLKWDPTKKIRKGDEVMSKMKDEVDAIWSDAKRYAREDFKDWFYKTEKGATMELYYEELDQRLKNE